MSLLRSVSSVTIGSSVIVPMSFNSPKLLSIVSSVKSSVSPVNSSSMVQVVSSTVIPVSTPIASLACICVSSPQNILLNSTGYIVLRMK